MLKTGIPAAGGIAVFITTRWPGEELAYGLDNSSTKLFLQMLQDQNDLYHSKVKNLTLIGMHDGEDTLDLTYPKLFRKIDQHVDQHGIQKMTIFNTYLSGPQATPQA